MTPEQINDLAKQIQSGLVWAQWPFYVLVLLLAVVLTYCGRRLSAYAQKVGEIDAITSQFEDLKAQLKENTKIVATINAEIAHGDWVAREWKTLRRLKLEQLLENVSALKEWQESFWREHIFQSTISAGTSPLPKIQLVGLLYLPELQGCITVVSQTHSEMVLLTLKYAQIIRSERFQAETALRKSDLVGHQVMSAQLSRTTESFSEENRAIYEKQLDSIGRLHLAAQETFRGIVGI